MPLVETRADVPVTIDASLCVEGCTLCVDICPLDSLAISPDSGKAYMHVDECWYCGPCALSAWVIQARRSVLERGAEVTDHAELGEDDRSFGVAVEALDLAVGQFEDVAARGVHPLAGRPQRPERSGQTPSPARVTAQHSGHANHLDPMMPVHLPGGKPGSGPPPGRPFQYWFDVGEPAWGCCQTNLSVITVAAAAIRNKLLTLVGHGQAATPAEVRRSAYAQLMRHAVDGKFALDLEQTRLDDISRTWEHLKAGAPRKLVVTP